MVYISVCKSVCMKCIICYHLAKFMELDNKFKDLETKFEELDIRLKELNNQFRELHN